MKKIPVKKYMYTNSWNGEIKKVEVSRVTSKSVVFPNGGLARIETRDTIFCDTPEEAFEWNRKKLENDMEAQKTRYLYYKKRYHKFIEKGMVCKKN